MTATSIRRLLGYLALALFALMFLYPFVLSAATSFKTRPDVGVMSTGMATTTRHWQDVHRTRPEIELARVRPHRGVASKHVAWVRAGSDTKRHSRVTNAW